VSSVQPTKVEAVAEGLRLATLIAEKSPLGVQGTKALINYSIDHTIQEGQ
jgi:delta(3,5)-delta(2,4)-dienoyl-CoA isomerase